MSRITRNIVRILFCLTAVTSSYGQDCTAILGAVQDVSRSEGSRSYYSSFKRFFCEQTFSSYQAAEEAGLKLNIPIKNLPISLDGHDKESHWSEYQHSVCESLETFVSLDVTWKDYLAQANSAVVEAWTACVNSTGLHFWAKVNEDDPTALTLTAKYVSSGQPFTTAITFSTPAVTCRSSRLSKGSISSAEKSIDCSRPVDSAATNITLHTRNGDPTIMLHARSTTQAAPSIKNNVFIPNAMISLDTDHGVRTESHTAPLSTFPIAWTGPNLGHPPLDTFAQALYKVELLAPAPSPNELAETMNVQTNVGGKCGAGATGGGGGVNPDWITTIELPRRASAAFWQVHLTSNNTHKIRDAKCSISVEGKVITVKSDGSSDADISLPFGEHMLEFSCSGENPSTSCRGHAGRDDHYETLTYSWTIDAKPQPRPNFGFR